MTNVETEQLARAAAKAARDFHHYFGTLSNPKLEEWIADSLKSASVRAVGRRED